MDPRNEYAGFQKTAVKPQQKDGGIIGFLRGAGEALGSSFKRVGEGTAEVLAEATGINQRARDQKAKQDEEDLKAIKMLGEKIKSAKTDQEKERYRQSLKRYSGLVDTQDADFVNREKQIAERTDPVKGAAAVGSIGLDVLSGGTLGTALKGAGLLSKVGRGASQGALAGGGQGALQAVQDKGANVTAEDIGAGALAGGTIGGVAGGALSGVANIPAAVSRGLNKGVLKKAGTKLEQAGSDLLGTQANLTRAEGRKIGALPSEVIGSIQKRTGVSDINTARRVADNITGQNGAYSELVRNAIGNSPGVDIGDLRKVADDVLASDAPLITGAQRKNILEQVKNSVVSTYGGSKGSLSTIANPLEALSTSQNFRTIANDIKRGASVSAADKQLAKVYDKLAKEIEDRLYKTPGIEEGLKLAAPDRARDLRNLAAKTTDKAEAKAYNRLADELENPNLTVKDLRSLQKDFVNLTKIGDATATAQAGAAAQLGDTMQGLGRVIQRPTNLLAIPLNAQTARVGGILSNAGRKLQGTGAPQQSAGTPGVTSQAVGAGVRIPGARGIGDAVQAPEEVPVDETTNEPYDTSAIYQGELPSAQTQSPFSSENIQKLILADLASTGGKNVNTLMSLYEAFGQQASKPTLNATQTSRAAAAANALQDIPMIEEAISSGKIGIAKGILGGNPIGAAALGTQDIDAALFNIADNILRARTGAAAPEAEIRRFMTSFLPGPFDTSEAKKAKLERAVRELEGYINPQETLTNYQEAL